MRSSTRPLRNQSGAALVVSLLILLVLTIIGVTGMHTTALEEKMAGNMRDRQIAFEAAEATLRYAEGWVDSNVVALGAFDSNGNDGLYNYDTADIWKSVDWTGSDDSNSRKAIRYAGFTGTSTNKPKFIVEHLQTVGSSEEEMNLDNYGQGVGGADLQIFRITARGTDESGTAQVYLQATYGKRM